MIIGPMVCTLSKKLGVSSIFKLTRIPLSGPPADFPHCNTSGVDGVPNYGGDFTEWLNDTFVGDGSGCWVKGAAARLYYWPEPVQESHQSCPSGTWTAPDGGVITSNSTGPVTKVVTLSDTAYNCCTTTVTMTSPTMYLSIEDVEARDASWGFAGGGSSGGESLTDWNEGNDFF
jgi:hypothetical protein